MRSNESNYLDLSVLEQADIFTYMKLREQLPQKLAHIEQQLEALNAPSTTTTTVNAAQQQRDADYRTCLQEGKDILEEAQRFAKALDELDRSPPKDNDEYQRERALYLSELAELNAAITENEQAIKALTSSPGIAIESISTVTSGENADLFAKADAELAATATATTTTTAAPTAKSQPIQAQPAINTNMTVPMRTEITPVLYAIYEKRLATFDTNINKTVAAIDKASKGKKFGRGNVDKKTELLKQKLRQLIQAKQDFLDKTPEYREYASAQPSTHSSARPLSTASTQQPPPAGGAAAAATQTAANHQQKQRAQASSAARPASPQPKGPQQ